MISRGRRLAWCALLTAIALTIFVLEGQIPLSFRVPGMKLGLSNLVTLYALFALGWKEALGILLARIFLGNVFAGNLMAMLYSLSGGLVSFAAMTLLRRVVRENQIWVCGTLGGIAHNLGQLSAAALISKTSGLLLYLPVLILCGMVTGAFTGLCAQLLLQRLRLH